MNLYISKIQFKLPEPERLLLIFSVVFGLVFVFLNPPFQIPDEPNHFYRALSITQGTITPIKKNISTGAYIPIGAIKLNQTYNNLRAYDYSLKEYKETLNLKIDNTQNSFVAFPNTALYSPVVYIPHVLGIITAKVFTDSALIIFYFGRLFPLFLYITTGYFTIKKMPFLKWSTLVVFLTPMNLILASGISGDTVLFCISAYFFALILYHTFSDTKQLSKNDMLLLSLLALAISLCKQHFFFTLFILLIPAKKFNGKYLKKIFLMLTPALFFTTIYSFSLKSLYVPLGESDPFLQLQYILSHPLEYAKALFLPDTKKLIILYQIIGTLGWNVVILPHFFFYTFISVILANTFFTDENISHMNVKLKQKVLLGFFIILNYVVISTLLYLSWSEPGKFSILWTIQGRYFEILILPFLTFLYLSIKRPEFKHIKTFVRLFTLLFLAVILAKVLIFLSAQYLPIK